MAALKNSSLHIFLLLCQVTCGALLAEEAKIEIDYSKAPECEAFAKKSQALCEKWYPQICALLGGPGSKVPYPVISLAFEPMDGVAATSANRITISAEWVTKKAPDDYGMVIHELTHIVQDYKGHGEGWLTEGIADYIRHKHFEPGKWDRQINWEKDSYKQGYTTAAAFLMWLEEKKDREIVRKLNVASREGKYSEAYFKTLTGWSVDEAWANFISARPGAKAK